MEKSGFELTAHDYEGFLKDLKTRIRQAQVKAALAVNQELILLYWQIGQDILQCQSEQGWGAKVIDRLSRDLKIEFPDMTGFSPRNLKYMRAFAEAYPDLEIVHQLGAQIPWKHNCTIIDKVKNPNQRLWYIQKTIENGWSRNVLVHQIESNLHDRQGGALTNFELTLPAPQSDLAQNLLKSEYNLEFLGIKETAYERELEQALLNHMQKFLLELGLGFSFMGHQYRLEVEGDEFFVDLLFYHVRLRCYVVIELKTTEFRPEYSGQINFYVNVIDDQLRHPDDQPTIGIVLCKSTKKAIVRYALRGMSQPIGVSTYELGNALPDAVQHSLPSVEQLQMELESVAAEFGTESHSS
ncbi:MAG: PDDEXK nuclease domain-containing protein [Prochlorotrichaceae cyanobacterium]